MYHIHNWCHKLLLAHTHLGQIAILSRQIKQHKNSNSSTKFGWRIWMILPKWLVFWGQVVAVEVQLQWQFQGSPPPVPILRPNWGLKGRKVNFLRPPHPSPSRLENITTFSTCIEVNSTECKHNDIKFPFCSESPSAALANCLRSAYFPRYEFMV